LRRFLTAGLGALLTLGPHLAVGAAAGASAAALPWLELRPGALARVDIAPWSGPDEAEAALTQSAASLRVDFSANGTRPADVLHQAPGVRARIVRVLPRGIVLVHGIGARWQAYALAERLVPEVPPGTHLAAAGNFGGFADFYPTLATPQSAAKRLPTASHLIALATGVAPYDPESSDLVRLHVRVTTGPAAGTTGWIAVAYTGVPSARSARSSSPTDRACSCRPIAFDGPATAGP
jgi:hypothetical protein